MSINIDIEKKYGSFTLSVRFAAGDETLALLGASGSGKSLTLKCIAGIERPDSGRIEVDGITLFDSARHIDVSPQERRTGLVFQNYALFPNMNVLENIKTGARRESDPEKRAKSVDYIIERFGLGPLTEHTPSMLSGGQQQRVALARILVSNPRILLLDEPFSALDGHLRHRMERELQSVIQSFGKTVILVSHNRKEVFRLSDRIAILDAGRVGCIGSKEEIFRNPKTKTGAEMTGCKNISHIRRKSDRIIEALDWGIELELAQGEASHIYVSPSGDVNEHAYVGIRSHDISLACGATLQKNVFRFDVHEEIENPFSYTVTLRAAGQSRARPLQWDVDKQTWERIRAKSVDICLPQESILLLEQ